MKRSFFFFPHCKIDFFLCLNLPYSQAPKPAQNPHFLIHKTDIPAFVELGCSFWTAQGICIYLDEGFESFLPCKSSLCRTGGTATSQAHLVALRQPRGQGITWWGWPCCGGTDTLCRSWLPSPSLGWFPRGIPTAPYQSLPMLDSGEHHWGWASLFALLSKLIHFSVASSGTHFISAIPWAALSRKAKSLLYKMKL